MICNKRINVVKLNPDPINPTKWRATTGLPLNNYSFALFMTEMRHFCRLILYKHLIRMGAMEKNTNFVAKHLPKRQAFSALNYPAPNTSISINVDAFVFSWNATNAMPFEFQMRDSYTSKSHSLAFITGDWTMNTLCQTWNPKNSKWFSK